MKLNPDCIRDILIAVESATTTRNIFSLYRDNCNEIFPQYDFDTIMYHMRQCDLYGYFYKASFSLTDSCHVIDLTPLAHEFLANIREDTNWNKTKNIAKKVGSTSLNTLTEIASNVISSLIQSYFQ